MTALSHDELAAEQAAFLARRWPDLREARARSLLTEYGGRGPDRSGRTKAEPVDENTLMEEAETRWPDETDARRLEIVERALELHADGMPAGRSRAPQPRSQRSTKGGKR